MSRRDINAIMDCIVRRVAAAQVAAVPEVLHSKAQALRAAGQYAAAAALLQQATCRGHLPSCADLADMLLWGREGVAQDHKRAFELVEEGARLGCHHCQGVMACCYVSSYGCSQDAARSLLFARASAAKGSKYGQMSLGRLYSGVGGVARDWLQEVGAEGGVVRDLAAAIAQYHLAAAQGYDVAQAEFGYLHFNGNRYIPQNFSESMRWLKLAAVQGNYMAMGMVGWYYENGFNRGGVAADRAEAIRWYKRAVAAGHSEVADDLKRLGV